MKLMRFRNTVPCPRKGERFLRRRMLAPFLHHHFSKVGTPFTQSAERGEGKVRLALVKKRNEKNKEQRTQTQSEHSTI